MIVFLDGVDGSGKTTLIRHLTTSLAAGGRDVHVAWPLWPFLTTITAPDDFPAWVTGTPGTCVAHALLEAQTTRIQHLGERGTSAGVLLVDRGPKTVDASARAHAGAAADPRQMHARQGLQQATAALLHQHRCLSIELDARAGHDTVVGRLHAEPPMLPRYRVYLAAFNAAMTTSPPWPGLPTVVLNALDPESHNRDAATTVINQHAHAGDLPPTPPATGKNL
jgi:hypothetical protein